MGALPAPLGSPIPNPSTDRAQTARKGVVSFTPFAWWGPSQHHLPVPTKPTKLGLILASTSLERTLFAQIPGQESEDKGIRCLQSPGVARAVPGMCSFRDFAPMGSPPNPKVTTEEQEVAPRDRVRAPQFLQAQTTEALK